MENSMMNDNLKDLKKEVDKL